MHIWAPNLRKYDLIQVKPKNQIEKNLLDYDYE